MHEHVRGRINSSLNWMQKISYNSVNDIIQLLISNRISVQEASQQILSSGDVSSCDQLQQASYQYPSFSAIFNQLINTLNCSENYNNHEQQEYNN